MDRFTVIAEAASQGYSQDQIAKAAALIAGDRIHPVPGLPGCYIAESSDQVTRYQCDRFGACKCASGRTTRRCYHGLAAKAKDASMRAAA